MTKMKKLVAVVAASLTCLAMSTTVSAGNFSFYLIPGYDAYTSGYKSNYTSTAKVNVTSTTGHGTFYYRVTESNNTSHFLTNTKNVAYSYSFNLDYDSGEAKPRSAYLRGYQTANDSENGYQKGNFTL